jgi:hypothetical protein
MPWGAAAAAGGAILGGLIASSGSKSAADTEAAAANNTTAEQRRQFDINLANTRPFLDTATAGTKKLSELMGLNSGDTTNSPLLRKFSSSDLSADPVYSSGLQFGMDEGRKAIESRNVANGSGYDSSATLRQIVRYANDYGTTKANDAYNRFVNDQSNIYSRLSGTAGGGQVATNLGQLSNESTNAITNTEMGAANARAAGIVGGANAWTGAISNLNSSYNNYQNTQLLKQLLQQNGGGGGGGVMPLEPGPG